MMAGGIIVAEGFAILASVAWAAWLIAGDMGVVTYLPPPRHPDLVGAFGPPLRPSDVPYFARRWSERWNEASVEHFRRKHGLGPFFRKRVRNGNEQRIAFLMPLRTVVRPVFGPRVDDKLTRGLHRLERRLNRRLVR